MQRLEYHTADKDSWGEGPWQDEPDKVQWLDPETNYPCLIVRNQGVTGALCGYVGVPKDHPAYGLDYDGGTTEARKARMKHWRDTVAKARKGNATGPKIGGLPDLSGGPEYKVVTGIGGALAAVEVHGGLTYANKCQGSSPEEWEEHKKTLEQLWPEAERYPRGDAARHLKEWGPIKTYEEYAKRVEATAICHKPDQGDPDDIWWFGFDCAHAWDFAPAMAAFMNRSAELREHEVYRDLTYVALECAKLAKHLLKMEEDYGS